MCRPHPAPALLSGLLDALRAAAVPVTITEFLALLEALAARLAECSTEEFYYLSRACLIKDERYYDRFDRVFAAHVGGLERLLVREDLKLPPQWLQASAAAALTEAERRAIESFGGWQELLEALRARAREQTSRHEGGAKWIGTAGRSPFGNHGEHRDGLTIGAAGQRRATRVWEQREYRNFDDSVELGTHNIKLALRRLRRFAREGAAEQLDLPATIDATARNAGLLDLKLVPERRNAVRVLLFLDVGGSMDDHVRRCEELFSAARSEFRHLEHFYFHNCPYESLWRDNRRRASERVPTIEVLRTYGRQYRAIFVGDAAMAPHEITLAGGSVEHDNPEAGAVWLERLCAAFPHLVWLNPAKMQRWPYTASTRLIRELIGGRMFALNLRGLDQAMAELRRSRAGVTRRTAVTQPT